MKTYEPRRNNECPNAEATGHTPYGSTDGTPCDCPWLIIQSTTPVNHLTSWNRRELDTIIREVDAGYFDPPGYPKRTGSMFLSPAMQRLLDVAEKEPNAAALTLLAGSGTGLPPFDALAWDAEDAVLSLRNGRGWWHLFLGHTNVEAVTNHDDAHAAGASPVLLWADHPDTAAETELPVIGPFSVAFPVPTVDYFAEDITRRIREGSEQIAAAPSVADVYEHQMFPPGDPRNDPRWKDCPSDLCAAQQAHWSGCPERPALPVEDMTETEQRLHANPELVEQINQTINDSSTRVRRERPLPQVKWSHSTLNVEEGVTDPDIEALKAHADIYDAINKPEPAALPHRVPQVPSQIAQAGAHCAVPVRVLYHGDDINISTAYCEKAAGHNSAHGGGGFAWSWDEVEITAPNLR